MTEPDQTAPALFLPTLRWLCRKLYHHLPPSICSWLASSSLGRFSTSWAAPAGETIYNCDYGLRLKLSREDALTSGIVHLGHTNPLETELIVKYVRKGDTVVEVGTYKDGWLALVASGRVGDEGKVICFEPIPEHYEAFKANIALNARSNVIAEQMAVSDVEGETDFDMAGTGSSLVCKPSDAAHSIRVKTVSLDGYLAAKSIPKAQFIIIDAEGAEPLIVRGASRLLKEGVNYMIVEVVDEFLRRSNSSAADLIQTLVALGFHPYTITRKGLLKYSPGMASETLNMFFSKEMTAACV